MRKFFKLSKSTLRVRLTAWYIFLLSCTLMLFSSYLYLQLKSSLTSQLDETLEVTALEISHTLVKKNGHFAFQKLQHLLILPRSLNTQEFAVRLVSIDGKVLDGFGNYQALPVSMPSKRGYANLHCHETLWRVYNQSLSSITDTGDWLQVAQSLDSIFEASEHLLTLMLLSCPLVLLIAAFGGLFLADRALRPIDNIIRTAQAICPNNFTQRIGNRGTSDAR